MKAIALVSSAYREMTRRMFESFRVWHPDVPAVCYAIPGDWTDADTRSLNEIGVDVEIMSGPYPFPWNSKIGWKLVALQGQTEPLLCLDTDMLVLRPLDRVFEAIEKDGWFSVLEWATLGDSYKGEITALFDLPEEARSFSTFNGGLIGYDPARYQAVYDLAFNWGTKVNFVWLWEQALANFAWYHLHGRIPPDGGHLFNGGWGADARFPLTQAILHFAGPYSPGGNDRRDSLMAELWDKWPRGERLVPLRETDFWKASLPHSWVYVNHCNQRRYRSEVKRIRQLSKELCPRSGVIVEDEYQAYLLAPEVRAALAADWAKRAPSFAGLPIRATYHLKQDGAGLTGLGQRARLLRMSLESLVH